MKVRTVQSRVARWATCLSIVSVLACAPRYTVTPDTLSDTTTGLTWQRFPHRAMQWDLARLMCAEDNKHPNSTGDWRLPTIRELETIQAPPPYSADADLRAYAEMWRVRQDLDWFWSSTPAPKDPGDGSERIWTRNVSSGQSVAFGTGPGMVLSVRCVRVVQNASVLPR